jgi:flagella basal body P-ring formation protein FlgA
LPLLRQYFAVNIRDNVGIASLCTVIHTAGMYKSIIIFALVLSSSLTTAQNIPVLSANKQGLIKQAKVWVAEQTKLETDQVEISATDRRLKIPRCDSMFDISFTYPSNQESIRISCPNTNWQVFVGVKLIKNTLGFAFKADMSAGQLLSPDDVKPVRLKSSIRGVIRESKALKEMSLSKPVLAGDLVLQQYLTETVVVFQIEKDILAGEFLDLENITNVRKPLSSTSAAQRLPSRLLSQSAAAKNLRAGSILSRDDIRVKHIIMVSQEIIGRGQKLSSANTALAPFYGPLPNDALFASAGISQMEAIRTISPGQPIRTSDLRPAPLIRQDDTVILSVQKGSLQITIPMIALDTGQLGEQITLRNPDSGEQVRAIVTGPRNAEIR